MSTTDIHLLQFNKVTCKNSNFKCRHIKTHAKEKPSRFSNITFCLFIRTNTQTERPSWVLWNVLLLMKPGTSYLEQNERRAQKLQITGYV